MRLGRTTTDAVFRALLSYGAWFVPVDAARSPALFSVEGADHLVASVVRTAPGSSIHSWMRSPGG